MSGSANYVDPPAKPFSLNEETQDKIRDQETNHVQGVVLPQHRQTHSRTSIYGRWVLKTPGE
jgi:hypothetical protein